MAAKGYLFVGGPVDRTQRVLHEGQCDEFIFEFPPTPLATLIRPLKASDVAPMPFVRHRYTKRSFTFGDSGPYLDIFVPEGMSDRDAWMRLVEGYLKPPTPEEVPCCVPYCPLKSAR